MAKLYYFDKEITPEEYIRKMILSNDGVRTYVKADEMKQLLDELKLSYPKKVTRNDMIDILLKNSYDWKFIVEKFGIGVNVRQYIAAFPFMTNADVKRLEKFGQLKVVGHQCYRAFNRDNYVTLYDLYQFLDMSDMDMKKLLADYPKGKRIVRND